MNADLFAELKRRANEIDCLVTYVPEASAQVTVYYQGKPLGVVLGGTLLTTSSSAENSERNEVYFKMQSLINEIKEYVAMYQAGTSPKGVTLPHGYRSLAIFNEILLTATKLDHGGYQFVTWGLDCRKTGLVDGRYTADYKTSKRNFVQRSGLLDKSELFSPSELQTIHTAVCFTLEHQAELSFDTSEQLQQIFLKIAHALPEPKEPKQETNQLEQTM